MAVQGQDLSPREREVMDILLTGVCQRGVAEKLGLSPNTVSTHLSRVKTKLGADNPFHALVIYFRKKAAPELEAFSWESNFKSGRR